MLGDKTVRVNTVEQQRLARATGTLIEGAINHTPLAAEGPETKIRRIINGEITVSGP